MPNICKECNTDLEQVIKDMAGEDIEAIHEAVKDCTLHDPNFDPSEYRTWPRGYVGTLIDRAVTKATYDS